jgi:hypothetical protein
LCSYGGLDQQACYTEHAELPCSCCCPCPALGRGWRETCASAIATACCFVLCAQCCVSFSAAAAGAAAAG